MRAVNRGSASSEMVSHIECAASWLGYLRSLDTVPMIVVPILRTVLKIKFAPQINPSTLSERI